MIKTNLEQILETKLAKLNMPFKDREYGDEIRYKAEFDGAIFSETHKNYPPPLKKLFNVIFQSENQVDDEFNYLFIRKSEEKHGFYVEYNIRTEEKQENPKQTSDKIIQNKKYIDEFITLNKIIPEKDELKEILSERNTTMDYFIHFVIGNSEIEYFEINDEHPDYTQYANQLAKVKRIVNKRIKPIEVPKIIIDFLNSIFDKGRISY